MAKRKSNPLKGREAETIAKKLANKEDIKTDGAHKHALIRYNGEVICKLGWRHDRTASNGHIPKDLRINLRDTLEMARCHIDYDGYIKLLKKKNLLPSN